MSNVRAPSISISAAAVRAACAAPVRKHGAYPRRNLVQPDRQGTDTEILADDARMGRDARQGSATLLARILKAHPERASR